MGCQGFVLGLQPSRQVLAFAVQSGSSPVSLRSWRTSSGNWFCPQGCDQLAQSLPSHGLLTSGGEGGRAGVGCLPGLPGGSAQSQSSEPRRAAGSVLPVFLHIWSRGRCWRSVTTPTPQHRLWHPHPPRAPWLFSCSQMPLDKCNPRALGSHSCRGVLEEEEEEGAVMLLSDSVNSHLCTPVWWEGWELRGSHKACPLHPCPHLSWWCPGSVSPESF